MLRKIFFTYGKDLITDNTRIDIILKMNRIDYCMSEKNNSTKANLLRCHANKM